MFKNIISYIKDRFITTPVRILFSLNGSCPEGLSLERLWAIPLPGGLYEIDNTPFNVYGLSNKDVIEIKNFNNEIYFKAVIRRSGHSTFRIRMKIGATHDKFLSEWKMLNEFGCSFEGCTSETRLLYSIDVPPEKDISSIINILERKESEGVWEYEEAHIYRKE